MQSFFYKDFKILIDTAGRIWLDMQQTNTTPRLLTC